MEERHKKFLLSLNPRYIRNNGRYVDVDKSLILTLKEEDIIFLRSVYGRDIASDIVINSKKEEARDYKLTRDDKYVGYKTRRRIGTRRGVPLIIGGIVVFVLISSPFLHSNTTVVDAPTIESEYRAGDNEVVKIIQDSGYRDRLEEQIQQQIEQQFESEEVKEESEREQWVRKYSDIYCLNYYSVYSNLVRLTNDFTSSEYLDDLHIEGVTCKGEEIYADNEEQLIMFYVRTCKQLPGQVGLKLQDITIDNKYDSGNDYASLIDEVCRVVGVDRNIYYAMIQGETGFDSDLFLNGYNPIGIRTDGKWWYFDTLEEGLIEGALELRKYNRMGAHDISEIALIHDPDEADFWIKLVGSIYKNEILPNQERIFGNVLGDGQQISK